MALRIEPRSMVGSAAQQCADAALWADPNELALVWAKKNAQPKRPRKLPAPQRGDGLKPGTCPRCGLRGPHANARECIDALRDKLAELE
jgi:hypothetical protein